MGIQFMNIDLRKYNTKEQYEKLEEEIAEFDEALIIGTDEEVKEELLDVVQAMLGLVERERNINAKEVTEYYPIWVKKLKNRPRIKEQ